MSVRGKKTEKKNKAVRMKKKHAAGNVMQSMHQTQKGKKMKPLTNGMPWACWPGIVGTGLPVARIFWWCSINLCSRDVS